MTSTASLGRARPASHALGRITVLGLVLVAIAPLVVLPGAADGYALPKAAVAGIGAALVLAGPRVAGLSRALVVALTACAGVLVAAALLSAVPSASLLGRFPRYEGGLIWALYLASVVAGARAAGLGEGARLVLLRSWSAAGAVGGLSALFGVVSDTGGYRTGGLLGNASDLGAWSAVLLVVLVGALLTRRDPWLWPGAAGAAMAMVLSGSRGALAGAIVGLLLVGILVVRGSRRWWALGAIALIALATLALPSTRDRVTGADTVARSTVVGRELLWSQSVDLWTQHPWLGVGPSGFVDAAGSVETRAWAADVGPANPPDSPHSGPLQLLLAGGAALATAALGALLIGARDARRRLLGRDRTVLAWGSGLAAYATALLVHFTSPATTPTAALLAGLAVAAPVGSWLPALRVPAAFWRWGGAALAAGMALVLALAALAERPFAEALESLATGRPASASFDSAQDLRPWDADLRLRRARAEAVAAESGLLDPLSALPNAERVAQELPESREAATALAALLEQAGRLDDAAHVLGRARRQAPFDVDLMLRSAVVDAERGRLAEAERLLREVIGLRPGAPVPWENLSVVLSQQGRESEAQEASATAQRLRGG